MVKKDTKTATLVSVKELASKLDVSDALLKKYVKDFEIPTQKVKNRTHLEDSSIEIVKEIVKLRNAGKKSKDIKAILTHVRSQEESAETATEEVVEEPKKAKTAKAPKAKAKAVKGSKEEKPKTAKAKTKAKTKKAEPEEEAPEVEAIEEKPEPEEKSSSPRSKRGARSRSNDKDRKKQNKSKKEDSDEFADLDVTGFLRDEMVENEILEGPALVEAIEEEVGELPEDEDLDGLDDIDELEEEETKSRSPGRTKRRKAFNFRYVQRQIANDSRRVNYIKNRLRRANISTPERLSLEDALDRRSKLLNGWLHILRWIKSRSSSY